MTETAASTLLPGVPLVESPFFATLLADGHWDSETGRIARDLNEQGYAVIDFPEPELGAISERIRASLQPRFPWSDWRDRGFAQGSGLRLQDAWRFDDDVRRLAVNSAVLELLAKLYGRRPFPFQTLNFPVGTQQHFHTDAVHFSTVPERFMCGVWLALEDVHEDAGPLVYYPGSHRWPIYGNEALGRNSAKSGSLTTQNTFEPLWEALVRSHGTPRETFVARQGQALIWAANLLHGGERQRNPDRTRWSQVTHYFFEDCVYYTPMRSDPFVGSIDFRQPIDVRTGEVVPQCYAGHPLSDEQMEALRQRPKRLPEGFEPALYLAANPDVARAGMDPAEHWLMYGMHEGRRLEP